MLSLERTARYWVMGYDECMLMCLFVLEMTDLHALLFGQELIKSYCINLMSYTILRQAICEPNITHNFDGRLKCEYSAH